MAPVLQELLGLEVAVVAEDRLALEKIVKEREQELQLLKALIDENKLLVAAAMNESSKSKCVSVSVVETETTTTGTTRVATASSPSTKKEARVFCKQPNRQQQEQC